MAEQPLETNYFTLWGMPIFVLFKDARLVLKTDSIGMEILRMAFPAALALAADPIASLIDTAFIGRIGAVELAAVGVSIAIFNQAARITIYPLVSITTSFVAQEQTLADATIHAPKFDHPENDGGNKEQIITPQNLEKGSDKITSTCKQPPCGDDVTSEVKKGKRHIPSASTAMFFGLVLGLLQTLFLVFGAKILLLVMGVKPNSPMMKPALKYLTLRSLGAPAVLLSLAMQGIFRGFKDTKTPLYATGVSGAAIAHVLSQYMITLFLLCQLVKQVELLPFHIKDLQFGRFLKNGVMLMGRVIAVTFCVTLSASMAARLGPTPMAAFQICLQVWLTSSLLADGLAVAGQAILACAFAEKDYKKVTEVAVRVLQMSFVMGMGLAVVVGVGLHFGSGIFSKDAAVLRLISIGVVFVAGTQPINSLAFVCDGVNFGSSDFAFTAYSMVIV
ncbi:MATE efflux family protein FRD3-like isoform X2 [Gossypium australe]|uniref:Protein DETOXIFICATION n=1 Tax=Gossypium australe TaxID=47621 RepID=A0A5B6VQ88_9ROSI|nr:MATE efflux family protein FRD3-like isoform X2 [Gossypium australe]